MIGHARNMSKQPLILCQVNVRVIQVIVSRIRFMAFIV
jgi:hypothetical protein